MAESPLPQLLRAYERFVAGGRIDAAGMAGSVRDLVRESWQRSVQRGVNPNDVNPNYASPTADGVDDFEAYRKAHRLASVRPLVRSLMLDDIAGAGVVVALTDRDGRLLWVEGDSEARDSAAAIDFVEGSVWSEDAVGTNAPGLALTIDAGVHIRGPEHFASTVHDWNCAAAPVHDPVSGEILGAIDVTGGSAAAAPFALAAVRSVVAAVERELRAQAVDLGDPAAYSRASPRADAYLKVLDGPSWTPPGGRAIALSPRHAEILLLLHSHPEGLSTEQLAERLSDGELGAVTVRAEISRLRKDLGDVIAARPYRLTTPATSDVAELRALAERGDLVAAVARLGRGGLLAASFAPGVVELFEELREDLRSRVLASADPSSITAWTSSPHGHDDAAAWRRLGLIVAPDDPRRAVADGRLRLLDRRYGRP